LDWRPYVKIDQRFFRPAEINELRGDASKAHTDLGWKPTIPLQQMVQRMVETDLSIVSKEHHLT
jgi:GDPmannose 4,6-dehydratase